MVVSFQVDFNGERLNGLASTVIELDDGPDGWNYDALDGWLVGYLRSAGGLTSRQLRTEAAITGEVGSGVVYAAGDKEVGRFTLHQRGPTGGS